MQALNKNTCAPVEFVVVDGKINLTHDDGHTETISLTEFTRDYETEEPLEIGQPTEEEIEAALNGDDQPQETTVVSVINQAETATPPAATAPVEQEVTLADLKKESTKGEKKGGKQPDPTSGRQAILRVMFQNGNEPMTPANINAVLKAAGREIKYISSHLNYFKSHAQIIHVEGTSTYKLADKTLARFQAEADKALVTV